MQEVGDKDKVDGSCSNSFENYIIQSLCFGFCFLCLGLRVKNSIPVMFWIFFNKDVNIFKI
jgi:hypothetical protein